MRRPLALVGLSLVASIAGATASSGCSQAPIDAPLRALESSGPVAFLCLGDPSLDLDDIALPLTSCSATKVATQDDYSLPHLYALVTQPNSGQVAVVDLTTDDDAVVDADPSIPGSNFLPVGALPTSIVSTPGGTATFVAAAEPAYEGIYALPSNMVRGGSPRLTSWPACALPSAPGEMVLVTDPPDDTGALRPSCDAAYGAADDSGAGCDDQCHGDLVADATEAGTPGRPKLLVTLPSEGGVAVIDAQNVLDRDAGTRDACVIERWLPLEVQLPPPPTPPVPPADPACVPVTVPAENPGAQSSSPLPAGLAVAGSRAYIADQNAPVIHRLEIGDPCDPHEIPPLVTSSAEDPFREVVTSDISVSPLTLDLRRYLYAIDRFDGSIMVYDVSDDGGSLRPLERSNPETNPFQPRDRIRFGAPPRKVLLLQHQQDEADDQTGATIPVRCDPGPDASSDAASYRTAANFSSGAGPAKLRGVFAFALLTSGDIVVIDVEDFDAACRGPKDQHPLYGCADPQQSNLESSGEYSCGVFATHQPRSGQFLVAESGVADSQPGITSFPVLFTSEGTVIQLEADDEEEVRSPRMRATTPENSPPDFNLVVGSDLESLDTGSGLLVTSSGETNPDEHTMAMNLIDPRAHILDQAWTVTYEGGLPGFRNRFAELVEIEPARFRLNEVSSAFCTRGVQSQGAIADDLIAGGVDEADAFEQAALGSDYVQIFSDSPVESDSYWTSQSECTFNSCNATYGSTDAPRVARDHIIVEAWEDGLELVPRAALAADAPRLKCCFPGVAEFRVRTGRQWAVVGDSVGFLHNMTIASDGTCRRSCDSDLELLRARVIESPAETSVSDDDAAAFSNPFFRFAINAGDSERDMQFSFTTKGRFSPMVLSVVTNDEDVQPADATFLRVTGEIVVSDGSLEGITFIDLDDLAVSRQFF
jgi:hypothetical protein